MQWACGLNAVFSMWTKVMLALAVIEALSASHSEEASWTVRPANQQLKQRVSTWMDMCIDLFRTGFQFLFNSFSPFHPWTPRLGTPSSLEMRPLHKKGRKSRLAQVRLGQKLPVRCLTIVSPASGNLLCMMGHLRSLRSLTKSALILDNDGETSSWMRWLTFTLPLQNFNGRKMEKTNLALRSWGPSCPSHLFHTCTGSKTRPSAWLDPWKRTTWRHVEVASRWQRWQNGIWKSTWQNIWKTSHDVFQNFN